MTGIGRTPPLSPRQPPPSPQDDPPKPRALEVNKKSPRRNFPVTKVEAVERRKKDKEKEIIQNLRGYESEKLEIAIESTHEARKSEPEIETVQVVSSPRGEVKSKVSFFENLSRGGTASITPKTLPRPLPLPPPRESDATVVQSPRRVALGNLPTMGEKPAQESEKPS
ncbi:MAG: hypothetical protein ABWZ27_06635 [Aestuariivirgaceae bacterium]